MLSKQECPLCGDAVSMGLATCLPCAGIGADGLLFATPEAVPASASLASRLRASIGRGAPQEALNLAAGGHRAIAAVPMAGREALIEAFGRLGIPVRLVPKRLAWATVPTGIAVSLVVMTTVGILAGIVAAPKFLLLTPFVAALILTLCQLHLREPVVKPRSNLKLLGSSRAARAVGRQLGALSSGGARTLLSSIAGLARIVEKRAKSLEDSQSLTELRSLVVSAAPVAGELERVSQLRAVLGDPEFADAPEHQEALAEVNRAAYRLESALNDAVASLGNSSRWDVSALSGARELPQLARSIETRMAAWDEALATVDQLVESGR
ncbi:MAG: hypothetical protein ACR2QM_03150 [Longimicrobiales bacterium]